MHSFSSPNSTRLNSIVPNSALIPPITMEIAHRKIEKHIAFLAPRMSPKGLRTPLDTPYAKMNSVINIPI